MCSSYTLAVDARRIEAVPSGSYPLSRATRSVRRRVPAAPGLRRTESVRQASDSRLRECPVPAVVSDGLSSLTRGRIGSLTISGKLDPTRRGAVHTR